MTEVPAWMKPVRRIEKAEVRIGPRLFDGRPSMDQQVTITFGEKVNIWKGDRLIIIQKEVPAIAGQPPTVMFQLWFVAVGEAMPGEERREP